MDSNQASVNDTNEKLIKELLKVISELKFIVAHNVRAPIASATGLIFLLRTDDCTGEDRDIMLQYLLTTIEDMDVHTRDIMTALIRLEQAFSDKSP